MLRVFRWEQDKMKKLKAFKRATLGPALAAGLAGGLAAGVPAPASGPAAATPRRLP